MVHRQCCHVANDDGASSGAVAVFMLQWKRCMSASHAHEHTGKQHKCLQARCAEHGYSMSMTLSVFRAAAVGDLSLLSKLGLVQCFRSARKLLCDLPVVMVPISVERSSCSVHDPVHSWLQEVGPVSSGRWVWYAVLYSIAYDASRVALVYQGEGGCAAGVVSC
jgi:hypothetical protein